MESNRERKKMKGGKVMSKAFSFDILARHGAARRGEIKTSRGIIRTPAFMPVGTAAAVKAMFPFHVRENLNSQASHHPSSFCVPCLVPFFFASFYPDLPKSGDCFEACDQTSE